MLILFIKFNTPLDVLVACGMKIDRNEPIDLDPNNRVQVVAFGDNGMWGPVGRGRTLREAMENRRQVLDVINGLQPVEVGDLWKAW